MCAKIVVQDIHSNTVHNSKNLETIEISSKIGEQINCGILIQQNSIKQWKWIKPQPHTTIWMGYTTNIDETQVQKTYIL